MPHFCHWHLVHWIKCSKFLGKNLSVIFSVLSTVSPLLYYIRFTWLSTVFRLHLLSMMFSIHSVQCLEMSIVQEIPCNFFIGDFICCNEIVTRLTIVCILHHKTDNSIFYISVAHFVLLWIRKQKILVISYGMAETKKVMVI